MWQRLLLSLGILSVCIPLSYASSSELTRSEALQFIHQEFGAPKVLEEVAMRSFGDLPNNPKLEEAVHFSCAVEALTCGGKFRPNESMSLPGFLKVFLTYAKQSGAPMTLESSEDWATPYIKAAVGMGLIDSEDRNATLSLEDAERITERFAHLAALHYYPPTYHPALHSDLGTVNIDTVSTRGEVERSLQSIKHALDNAFPDLNSEERHEEAFDTIMALKTRYSHYVNLLNEMNQAPLWYDESYPEEDRKEFRELGIKELVGEGYYDFRNNAWYRKTNVRNSLDNAHKFVLQPGDEFNYWDLMWKVGLGDVINGWVISGGEEVWAWGGGLCGTATALFRGAYFAGLEIIERKNHSIYYGSLYDPKLIGLDAAVYANRPNLRFKNSTGAPLMIYLKWNENRDEAWVQMLGTKHFQELSSSEVSRHSGGYHRTRNMVLDDGSTEEYTVSSYYRKIK